MFYDGTAHRGLLSGLRSIHHYIGYNLSLESVVLDFEAGMWKAVRERFPEVDIQGCAFHWVQAVYRRVQNLGLQNIYTFYQRGDVHHFVRQVMCLHLLPPEHIKIAFNSLRRKTAGQLELLMAYIDKTWISSRTFPIECWSTYQVSVRTNNDVEGWNNRLNTKCNTRGPVPFYLLVEALYKEARDIPLQLQMVSEGKLQQYQRRNFRDGQKSLFDLWARYELGDISTSYFLKSASHMLD